VTPRRAARDALFGPTWVHVFEEDTPAGAVYRAEDGDIPLSRRPRARLKLDRDGSAHVFVPGPADRPVEQAAHWRDENGVLVVRSSDSRIELRITERSPERLVVQTPPPRPDPAGGA
jgi:hypothetical protein